MKCPNCGNEDIQINEAFDKTIDIPTRYKVIYWVIVIILGLFSVVLFSRVNKDIGGWLLIITIILAVGARTAYYSWRKKQRKKSHSKCICTKCGNTWYID